MHHNTTDLVQNKCQFTCLNISMGVGKIKDGVDSLILAN